MLIDQQAQCCGRRRFLSFRGETFSFADLSAAVLRTAAGFSDLGIRPGDRVAVMMDNEPDHIFCYLALSWIGATVIEFSVFLKRSGVALQLEDCDPHWILCDARYAPIMSPAAAKAPSLRTVIWHRPHDRTGDGSVTLDELLRCGSLAAGSGSTALDRLQAISFTSGTTGRPKGAMLTDRYFQVGAKNAGLLADVRAGDILFHWEPLYHLAGWMTVLISLQHGVPMVMVERFSGSNCLDQVRAAGATTLHYLGGVMNILLKQPVRADDADNPIRIAWGAAAPERSWRNFEERFGVTVREGYGISEGQNFTHANLGGPVGSIGKPVPEFEAWIAGEDGRRLGPGSVGEIVLRPHDPRVAMQGYFRDPERTAQVKRDGCLYTGDLGFVDDDGYYFFAGRKKDSLRRRGENVSAWEVERVINAHPAVEEAAVIGVASDMGEQDIKAVVKLAEGKGLDPVDLIGWCERELAYYQIPRFVEFVADFPRGPTQRIMKSDLLRNRDCWDLEQSGYKPSR